ncbi:XkdW family protein [Heyndrickxia oleronia]|uniref:XkdW family protein n=1 Tax=Heyndrickxia oleronia TaxID=38875 RepID=A0AAW6SWG1_9BACI|nr:XkdW family protein [Heyndrickxia oleronia]MDH5160326.1 XkdW family protein [Heyndrickxia oleronia]
MRIQNEVPLSKIKEMREKQESIPISLDAIGLELVQEKFDHAQTKEMVAALGQELVKTKLEVANLKGGKS